MKIDHIAIFVKDLEASKAFYQKYFAASANGGYYNPKSGLRTYFLSFDGGARIKIMHRPDVAENSGRALSTGYAHMSFCVGSKSAVDALIEKLQSDGVSIAGFPRTTGDGYYEACVFDPDGNQVEIVA